MKNSNAVIAKCKLAIGVKSDELELYATDFNLDLTADYSVADKGKVSAVAASILFSLIEQSRSEGGFSVSFDRKAVEANIKRLAKDSDGLFELPSELNRNRVRSLNFQ